jgi:diketogulonate reductase-like aldo/keto reductase
MMTRLAGAIVVASASAAVPTISLGTDIHGVDVLQPMVGAGTWQYNDTVSYQSVCAAFEAGYTFVDTANGYGNQKGVGAAIKDCWKGKREDLFVMTKIPGGLDHEETLAAHRENMDQLGLTYVDHLMTHFPADWGVTPERSTPERRQAEWKALEKIYNSGEARSIGVSHYCSNHIDDVLAVATVRPSVNQVEYHVGSQDIDHVIEKCKQEGIHFMSFSTLCGPCDITDPKYSLITGDLVTSIGAKYGKSGPQVSLKYSVQQGFAVIPKSANPSHLASNIDLFDFELSDEDMAALSSATQPVASGGDCDVTAALV